MKENNDFDDIDFSPSAIAEFINGMYNSIGKLNFLQHSNSPIDENMEPRKPILSASDISCNSYNLNTNYELSGTLEDYMQGFSIPFYPWDTTPIQPMDPFTMPYTHPYNYEEYLHYDPKTNTWRNPFKVPQTVIDQWYKLTVTEQLTNGSVERNTSHFFQANINTFRSKLQMVFEEFFDYLAEETKKALTTENQFTFGRLYKLEYNPQFPDENVTFKVEIVTEVK